MDRPRRYPVWETICISPILVVFTLGLPLLMFIGVILDRREVKRKQKTNKGT